MRSTKALPGRPGSADCPKCGRKDVTTRWQHQREEYVMHDYVPGGVNCHNSGVRVKRS